jgi:hypothetical protein
MSRSRLTVVSLLVCVAGGATAVVVGCADPFDAGVELTPSRLRSVELTVGERFAACADDPRVVARRVSREVCAGADRLFGKASEGHGRACGSCHPAGSDTTLDVAFFEARPRRASLVAPLREGGLMF